MRFRVDAGSVEEGKVVAHLRCHFLIGDLDA